jgi:hypothetical protein
LLALARQLQMFNGPYEHPAALEVLNRPFLALMLAQTSQLEETADAYGAVKQFAVVSIPPAGRNRQTVRFGALSVAALDSHRSVLRLLPVDGDFMADRGPRRHHRRAILEAGRQETAWNRARHWTCPFTKLPLASEELAPGQNCPATGRHAKPSPRKKRSSGSPPLF